MRRLINLENDFYHKSYREIYKLLFSADLDNISDHSNWYKKNPDYVEANRPLWIIAESKILNKRIWIVKDFGNLEISTAQLDLDTKTSRYSDSFVHTSFKNKKEMVSYLEKLLEPCLEETREEEKFHKHLIEWKDGIEYANERKLEFYEKEDPDTHYMTLKDVGEQYSKKIANIMFELGYGEWIFLDLKTIDKMQSQMIDVLEEDEDLNEILEEKGLTREQLFRKIKENFIEEEISAYLEENYIDIGQVPEETKNKMINHVRKGMLDNYSYKFIIWDSGDLEALVETLPENCFVNENTENNINEEDCEEQEL